MPVAEPLIVAGAYGPFIHVGGRNRSRRSRTVIAADHCYWLIGLDGGTATLTRDGVRTALVAPAVLLLPPQGGWRLELHAGTDWLRLAFDAVHVPLRRGRLHATRVHATPAPQPPPERVWGAVPPVAVPAHLVGRALALLHECCETWWRDDLGLARANALLGLWLCDYLAASVAPAGDRWLDRCRRVARDRLETGIAPAGLARALGLTPRTLCARLVAASGERPRALIARLRLEQARNLLQASDLPIGEIARRCGIRSSATFANRFRAETGCSPAAWRARQRDAVADRPGHG